MAAHKDTVRDVVVVLERHLGNKLKRDEWRALMSDLQAVDSRGNASYQETVRMLHQELVSRDVV